MANPLATIPQALKKITPYMKRAEELDKDTIHPESRAVAYYCRAYAMDQAMLLRDPSNQKEVMPFLLALMDRLEVDKKGAPLPGGEEGKALVRAFADRVFTKADEEDQIGVADKNTARTFYAAGVFYDVIQQFQAVPGEEGGEAEAEAERELERRRKYCKWKAADILNAIKEGRTPTAGGYGSSMPEGGEGAETDGPPATAGGKAPASAASASSPPPPAYTAAATAQPAPSSLPPPPYQAPAAPAPSLAPASVARPATAPRSPPLAGGTKQAALDDAKELCYFAIAAIQHREPALAMERLEKALQRLQSIA